MYFAMLGLETADARMLFSMLDVDEDVDPGVGVASPPLEVRRAGLPLRLAGNTTSSLPGISR